MLSFLNRTHPTFLAFVLYALIVAFAAVAYSYSA